MRGSDSPSHSGISKGIWYNLGGAGLGGGCGTRRAEGTGGDGDGAGTAQGKGQRGSMGEGGTKPGLGDPGAGGQPDGGAQIPLLMQQVLQTITHRAEKAPHPPRSAPNLRCPHPILTPRPGCQR